MYRFALASKDSCERMLFIDYSSAFKTVISSNLSKWWKTFHTQSEAHPLQLGHGLSNIFHFWKRKLKLWSIPLYSTYWRSHWVSVCNKLTRKSQQYYWQPSLAIIDCTDFFPHSALFNCCFFLTFANKDITSYYHWSITALYLYKISAQCLFKCKGLLPLFLFHYSLSTSSLCWPEVPILKRTLIISKLFLLLCALFFCLVNIWLLTSFN